MGIKVQDLSATAIGSALAIADWWDSKRIRSEILTHKALLKKAGFHPWRAVVAAVAGAMGEFRGVSRITSAIAEMASAFNSTEGYKLKVNRLVTILAEMVSSTLSWEEHHGRLPYDKH
jgi:endonuclease III-like uncharacterized protein